jgi:serine/threonine protein kinase
VAGYKLHKSNEDIRLVPKHFAGGGEGNLYRIQYPSRLAPHFIVKLYHPHKLSTQRANKLRYLMDHPPADFADGQGPPAVVWVYDIVEDDQAKVVGFMMPLVRGDKLELLTSLKIPKKASSAWQRFAFGQPKANYYRLRLAFNIAVAIQQVHSSEKYVLVDLKPDNIIAQANGIIALVDMDSVEVVENGESIFDAPVATPEYTPPEHYIKDQLGFDPTENQAWDRFSLAVIFYKLFFGIHPFAGANKAPYDHCLTLEQKIEAGLFVHAPNQAEFMAVTPPPHRQFEELDEGLKALFMRAFVDGHHDPEARPTAEEWCVELLKTIDDPDLNSAFGHLSLPTTPEAIHVKRRLPSQIFSLPEYEEKAAEKIIPAWFRDLSGNINTDIGVNTSVVGNQVRFRKKSNGGFALFLGVIILIVYIMMFFNIPVIDFFFELIGETFEILEEFEGFGFYLGMGLLAVIFIGVNKMISYSNFLFSKEFNLKRKTLKSLEKARSQFNSIKEKAIQFQQQLNFSDQIPEIDELLAENNSKIQAFEAQHQEADQAVLNLVKEEEAAYKSLHQEYLSKAKANPMLQHIDVESLAEMKMMLMEEKVDSEAWERSFESLKKILQDYKLAYKGLKEQFNKIYKGILEEKKLKIEALKEQIAKKEAEKAEALAQRLSENLPLEEVEKIKIELDQSRTAVQTLAVEKERYRNVNYKVFQKK